MLVTVFIKIFVDEMLSEMQSVMLWSVNVSVTARHGTDFAAVIDAYSVKFLTGTDQSMLLCADIWW